MKKYLIVALLFLTQFSFAQVYNFGSNEVTFKNLVKNGITYVRTGNAVFDSIMIANLEEHWTLTEFSVVDQYKKPHKSSTALFVTTKEWTQKHMMDRKNQHVLVLQPAHIYMPRKEVKMEQTLGYMYLNGFYDLVGEEDEHRFIYMLVKSLNKGFTLIKEKKLTGEPASLNDKVASEITNSQPPAVGHTLILNREQTRHAVVTETLDKMGIEYRTLGEKEYYTTLDQKDPTHIILYFAVNRFTELALVRVSDGKTLYAKHFREKYLTISKKEWKAMAPFFK